MQAAGLQQASADHSAVLRIFELPTYAPKTRFADGQDPNLASSEALLDGDEISEAGGPSSKSIKVPRATSESELEDVLSYWATLPRGSAYHDESSLARFLGVFTPAQVKGAMHIAKSKKRPNYFKYLCGILHNWRKELEAGKTPKYFTIG